MRNRIAAVASGARGRRPRRLQHHRPQTPSSPAPASVTVNGNDVKFQHRQVHPGRRWYRTIDIGGDISGATVVVDQHASVRGPRRRCDIHNLGRIHRHVVAPGRRERGQHATLDGEHRRRSAAAPTAASPHKPTEAASADFKISAKC